MGDGGAGGGVRRVVTPMDRRLLGTRLATSGQLQCAGGDRGRVFIIA